MRQKSSDQLLLTTKLTIPSTRSDIVLRPRLFNKPEASKDYPLTLLAAPAGSGKTVVLSAWAHQQQSASWVSLDSGDNDPVQFWSYVLAALNTLFPDLGIVPLSMRTEGWIAGLQLAALSLQGREDVATFVSAFTGSHRYIVDYLAEEVLGQQPADIRTFLLYTSLLERLNGPLCDAVTGQSNGQIMLEQLEQANLFLLPLDDKRYWFRYHHLFAEALQFRLNQARPGLLPILYQRASTWFESYGFISEAINSALAAHDFERAATLIEPILHQMFNHGTHATVRHWLQALPEEVLYARPSLCLQYAWAFLYVGAIKSCQRPLEVAERAWRADGNMGKLGEVYIFQSSISLVQGDAIRALNFAQQALSLLSENDLINRCNYATYVGASHLLLGNIREASHLLNEALLQCQPVHLYSTLHTMNFVVEM